MNFSAIPRGEPVFVDANVFVYNFAPDPLFGPGARDLLERIEGNDVQGYVLRTCSMTLPTA